MTTDMTVCLFEWICSYLYYVDWKMGLLYLYRFLTMKWPWIPVKGTCCTRRRGRTCRLRRSSLRLPSNWRGGRRGCSMARGGRGWCDMEDIEGTQVEVLKYWIISRIITMCDLCLFCHHLRYGWDIDSVYLLSSLWWWLEIISPRREVYVPYNNTLLNNRLFCSWKCTGFMFTCFLLCLKSGSLWPYLLCWFDLFCVCIGSIHCGVDEKVKWMHVEWASLMCS